jgi:hypothetical protein
MKPQLKAPGNERLTLKCDILLSTSAFKFNLRRYTAGEGAGEGVDGGGDAMDTGDGGEGED